MTSPNRRRKTLLRSKTVWSAILFLIAYYGAKAQLIPNVSPENLDDVLQAIVIIGVAAMAVFLRQGLVDLLDTKPELPGVDGEAAPPLFKNKSLFVSKTFLMAILVVVAHFGAKNAGLATELIQAIPVFGGCLLVIFLRHGMLTARGSC